MKIVRHIAPDMRTAMRAIRDKLGEDAVILSSRRIPEGLEITAAIDFDTTSLNAAQATPSAAPLPEPKTPASTSRGRPGAARPVSVPEFEHIELPSPAARQSAAPVTTVTSAVAGTHPTTVTRASAAHTAPAAAHNNAGAAVTGFATSRAPSSRIEALTAAATEPFSATVHSADALPYAHILDEDPIYTPSPARVPPPESIIAHVPAAPADPVLTRDPIAAREPRPDREMPATRTTADASIRPTVVSTTATVAAAPPTNGPSVKREPTLNLAPAEEGFDTELFAEAPSTQPGADTTGSELKTLRRMLETQLAQLAWNDMTRRAPVHVEILRELTEIGISQELSDYILKQLPDSVELGFARRFAIAGLSQYLLVTGDRWLDNGGRVAFMGATGVGKTTTIAKLAVRWVLRHGPRDLALVGCDTVRIGAQDQIQALGQLLGVPAYTPDHFESLPTLLSQIGDRHRLILIDTPGSSLRDPQLSTRLGVLANTASKLETALVLSSSTQAGAIEETVKRFAPANPACCVLTKLDEAASLGGALSVLIKARVPVSYVSEGQRVPEDLRPARALELVSTAVRLAKASGAAADEDLLRRRFGKSAHAIS